MAPFPLPAKLPSSRAFARRARREKEMNLTIGTAFPNTWKRIRMQYVSLACGLALAVGAVVGLSAWQGGSAGSSVSPTTDPARVASSQPAVTFYIVGSAEEARAFYVAQQARLQPAASQQPLAVPIVAGSFDESALRQAAAQLLGVGEKGAAAFRIVDLRGR